MHRCNCSTRALESFIKDFGGIVIRQQRAQRFFQHYRSLSTRPPLRQLQTNVGGSTDDAFIPFDFEAARRKREDVRQAEKSKDVGQKEEEALTSEWHEEPGGGQEWHAGVEITTPDVRVDEGRDRTLDEMLLQTSHAEGRNEASSSSAVPVLDLPALSQHIPARAAPQSGATLSPEPKAAARLRRKLRRMEEGKYKPTSMLDKGTEAGDYGATDDILEIIESLEGKEMRTEVPKKANGSSTEVLGMLEAAEATKEKKKKMSNKDSDSDRSRTAKTTAKATGEGQDNGLKTREAKDKSTTKITTATKHTPAPKKERWQIDKAALQKKFVGQGWQPRKRLSPDTLEGIRALHSSDPATYSTQTLASHFQITPEAIRRILKSKWQPSAEDNEKRMLRWEKRGLKKWGEMAEQGMRPPKKWRTMGVGKNDGEAEETKTSSGRKGKDTSSWDDAVEAAGRLPMEGSFADRIL